MQETIEKMYFVFEIMPLQVVAKFSMFRREYLSSVVNVLINSVKISDQTIADFFQVNLRRIHEKLG